MNRRPVQIVPAAAGWRAVFINTRDSTPYEIPIACFALVQDGDGDGRSVTPVMPTDGAAYLWDDENYAFLLGPGEHTDDPDIRDMLAYHQDVATRARTPTTS